MAKLTNKEYCATGGNECPFCGSENLGGQDFYHGSGIIWQDIICRSCDKEWTDVYKLSGYEAGAAKIHE